VIEEVLELERRLFFVAQIPVSSTDLASNVELEVGMSDVKTLKSNG